MRNAAKLTSIHPFPARMAPSIVWKELPPAESPLRVLDPMAGSGTTLVTARLRGHKAIGFDTDPLAVLMSQAWCADIDEDRLRSKAKEVVLRATRRYRELSQGDAYPPCVDEETRSFLRFWFDPANRRQLTALSETISRLRDCSLRSLLWCAFSRLIITKSAGASLAMDISHSRPHRVYENAPIRPLERFLSVVESILKVAPFKTNGCTFPQARVAHADARNLPLADGSVNVVITSPPYLNAIDYLRGHKFSLVWMGHTIGSLRAIRSANVGSEFGSGAVSRERFVAQALGEMGRVDDLPDRIRSMLVKYILDMDAVLREIRRVLIENGRAVLVVGDSTIRGVFVRNSKAIAYLGEQNGFFVRSIRRRPLPENRRYLPPPTSKGSGAQLQTRMREEVIMSFGSRPL